MGKKGTGALRLRACAFLLAGVAFPTSAFAGTVLGTVSDATGTRTLQAAEIEIVELGRTTQAEADGSFRFPDVPAGTYNLRARYTGAEPVEQQVTVSDTGNVVANIALGSATDASILVVGQRANLSSAISRQRASDTVDTVLTRDAIGQFPDQNVAEALRRAPGINILNDQGEGRFVSVRGLDPNLNSASINGNRVPAPESDVRSVALDVIPTELVESIEIHKSLTPDMDADTIGASIEINTTSAFDRRRPFLALSAEGSFNDRTNNWSPKGSVDFATRLGDDFGIAGGLSYYRRRFATDGVEPDGWDITDDGVTYADTVDYRDYDVTRTRIGGSLSLDWRPSQNTTLYARGLWSQFDDQEYKRGLVFEMDEPPSSGTATTANFLSDDGEIDVTRELKDRFERQRILSLTLGGETHSGPWTLRYSGAYSRSSEEEHGSLDPTAFQQAFEDPGALGVTFDYSNPVLPRYSITAGNANFLNPALYTFDELSRTALSDSVDREAAFRADITRSFPLASGTFDVQGGARARLRTKRYNANIEDYDGFDGDYTLADVLGRQSYQFLSIDPVSSPHGPRDFFDANRDGFELNEDDSAIDSAVDDYRVEENIYAGYLMGRVDTGGLRAVFGVRMEHTDDDLSGNQLEEGDDLVVTPVRFTRHYTDWLPSLNVRYRASRDVLLRLGGYRSIVRPNFADFAPRIEIEDGEGSLGNPDLKPYHAWNLDLSAEYYFAPNAVVQAGFFYKSIDDFIVRRTFDDFEYNGDTIEAEIAVNGDRATVTGLEFAYQQALTFLPSPFDGLLLNFNYTFTDTDADIDGRSITLPAASRHTFNAVLGYEKGPISFRVAGTYRSSYLDELGDDAGEDRLVRHHFQVDGSIRYRILPHVQIFAEMVNLNNAPYTAFQRGPGSPRLLQHEEYGWTGKFGVRANF